MVVLVSFLYIKKWGCQIYKYTEEYDPFVFVSKECIPFAAYMKKWGCQIYKYIEEYDPFVFVSKECIPFATWFSFFFFL
jgi:hypothetical protein